MQSVVSWWPSRLDGGTDGCAADGGMRRRRTFREGHKWWWVEIGGMPKETPAKFSVKCVTRVQ